MGSLRDDITSPENDASSGDGGDLRGLRSGADSAGPRRGMHYWRAGTWHGFYAGGRGLRIPAGAANDGENASAEGRG